MKYELTPAKIIYNGVATVVFWNDGTKTVVKRSEGTKDDKYNAFCAALAKKVFGTNSKLKNCIKEAENAKRFKSTPTKARNDYLDAFSFSLPRLAFNANVLDELNSEWDVKMKSLIEQMEGK